MIIIGKENKKEIFWNIINSLIAGSLVFVGSFSSGELSWRSLATAGAAALLVAITKFGNYWASEKKEYTRTRQLFNFV